MMNILLSNSKLNIFLFFLQFLLRINPSKSVCSNGNSITDASTCFNNLIKINNYYRGAQFTTFKDGKMIIEYSRDPDNEYDYRLFYGLKKMEEIISRMKILIKK